MSEFARAAEGHRRELLLYCYRMLGSLPDAEDAVQETLLRAWRYRDSLKEGAPLRPWLYRVATNACLDAIARDERRAVLAARAAADDGAAGKLDDVVWLRPIPDSVLDPPTPPTSTPEAITLTRETIEIAFLTVIQLLTPQQRAVLILCDVLDWSAKEAADLLDTSVPAVNSALQRARARLRERMPSRTPAWPASVDASAAERDLLKKVVEASEAGDVRAFESIIRTDATFRMPPEPGMAAGREEMFRPVDRGRIRLRTIRAPPLRGDPRQPAASGRQLCAPARRFRLASSGAGCSSNRGRLDRGDRDLPSGLFPAVRAPADDGRGAGDEHVSLIYSMLMSLDGYVEDEHGASVGALPKTKRCIPTSTTSRRQWTPTSTAGGCTRRWSTGRPRTRFPTSRRLRWTGRGSGRRLRRSFTPGASPSRGARGRGSNASSIPRGCGGSRPTSATTSPLTGLSSQRTR